jgi:hypothetical protein
MTKVRAVLVRHRNGDEEWLCAVTDSADGWMVPDTQCGGYYELPPESVLRSVDISDEA